MIDLIFSGESEPFWLIAKLFVLFALLLYVIFAYVVVKQVMLMNETLEIGFEKAIKIAAVSHLGLAICVIILAVIIL